MGKSKEDLQGSVAGSGVVVYEQAQNLKPEELIDTFLPIVKRVALHLMGVIGSRVPLDDLFQAGLLGLLEAAQRYDGKGMAGFRQFAMLRVRGAMIDELRQSDGRPRAFREDIQRINQARRQLESSLGRAPTDREIADSMGISVAEYGEIHAHSHSSHLVSLDDVMTGREAFLSRNGDLERGAIKREGARALASAITELSAREQLLLSLYYNHELNMKEVALVLDISEARVCQLHRQALSQLKEILAEDKQDKGGESICSASSDSLYY
ncbi:RNA polymerase sigma factor FliA [Endozoicomonas sp. Mp262]|uniref:RNA polymerase sigma factor FliA n=1 Tax=Endozoicomonas sp. Mp262 TaxID=2919499 RepID=UPI0021D9E25A